MKNEKTSNNGRVERGTPEWFALVLSNAALTEAAARQDERIGVMAAVMYRGDPTRVDLNERNMKGGD